MLIRTPLVTIIVLLAAGSASLAQNRLLASPVGASSTQVGGKYDERDVYVGGKWIEVRYGRPIKRGRDLFGPSDYAEFLNDGAPVWRAGANVSTRLNTEVAIVIGGKTIAPGEYSLFIDLQGDVWMFIVSSWPAQTTYDTKNKQALFGAFDYTPDRDIVRTRMTRTKLPYSFDQLAWEFLNMNATGGRLAIIWDTQMAWVPFKIAR
ncbi:MAG TPA: DUF2911 domain-containing protein [Bryobacteraceae bacterium]|nr:DUF2911 domain-containing protein [Bryobacteraceae bacterium]